MSIWPDKSEWYLLVQSMVLTITSIATNEL